MISKLEWTQSNADGQVTGMLLVIRYDLEQVRVSVYDFEPFT